ncbi:MAG: endonuclease MutS2 [bacterium]|nr:endonuclease MutS2 [bacterium]
MNNYPSDIERKLGFDIIREKISGHCLSSLGENFVGKISPSTDPSQITKLLNQTNEFSKILTSGQSFPDSHYLDASDMLKKASVDGAFLDQDEFYDLKVSLVTIDKCLSFFETNKEEYPNLYHTSQGIDFPKPIIKEIEAIIDEKGQLRDNASQELQQIRRDLVKSESQARNSINSIMKSAQKDGFSPDDSGLTVRSGRLVIPVLAEHKRRLKGFVHDESSTGQTVYIEPAEVLEINNKIKELEYQEKREIVRILTALTGKLRPYIKEISKSYFFLGMVDFIRAKAKLALEIDAVMPEISSKPTLEWFEARHPILQFALKEQGKKVIPLSIKLDQENRILLISGPNAGGKSVCLKTVGLVQYMFQCGLLVPASEVSKFGVFSKILIDIGDDQSLENDLSTYSSHLTNMREFMDQMNGKTLFLIDEFGTGTEPQFGGAIAEAILKQLNHKRGYGVITTHYANLKKLAEKKGGIINGAMKYDVERLEPLYTLEIGKPGSSFALEIAGKIGLNKDIIASAKKLVGHTHVRFDELINSLEKERNQYKEKYEKISSQDKELERAIKDYSDLKKVISDEQKNLIKEAKKEAKQIVEEANRKVEATIRTIKERKADKNATRKAREKLGQYKGRIEHDIDKSEKKVKKQPGKKELKVGDKVKISGQDGVGEVVKLEGKKAEVNFGLFKSLVKLDQLEKATGSRQIPNEKKIKTAVKGIDLNQRASNFKSDLDVRGKRAEEVIGEIDSFVDQAIILGYNQLRVLHGKGHGVLREIIRNHLKQNPSIAQMADEHVDYGGAGITVITLKD